MPSRSWSPAAPNALALALALTGLCGCAAERPEPASPADARAEISLPPAPSEAEPPRARPRLSQTLTLGQGTPEGVYGTPAAPAAPSGPQVTVQNDITIVNQAGPRGYGYGGYGYGYGYGNRAGVGRTDPVRPGGGGGTGPWAPSGWEGAQRTAAPGQTPGIGGNWSPAPSFGPRTMK